MASRGRSSGSAICEGNAPPRRSRCHRPRHPPPGRTPVAFLRLETGVEREVIGVDYLRRDRAAVWQPVASAPDPAPAPAASPTRHWQTVLYFETTLSNGRGRKRTANELMKHV